MGFSFATVSLLVTFFISTVVVIIGTGSPDWAHANAVLDKDARHSFLWQGDVYNEDAPSYSDSESPTSSVSSTGVAESNTYHLNIDLSPFGYVDSNSDNFFWLKPNCKLYDVDGDFVYEIPTNNECDELRSIQVMSLFSCFFSFFAFVGAVVITGKGDKGRGFTLVSSFLAASSGVIAMSIFVNEKEHARGSFFSAGNGEFHYGYSLGLFTGGWCLNFIGFFILHNAKLDNEKPQRPHLAASHQLIIFFFFVAVTSLVIGTGSPEWAVNYDNGEIANPNLGGRGGEINVGPFGFFSVEENKYYWLRPNCVIYNEDGERYATIDTRALCDEYRTEQCFAILACVFAFLGLVSALKLAFKSGGAGPIFVTGLAAGACGVIAMAEFIDQKDSDRAWFTDGGDYWEYGYSLGLFTAGWMASLVGGFLALCLGREGGNAHKHPSDAKPNTAAPSIQASA
jgi:hypothetical protein